MALKETLEKLISFRTVTGRNEEIARAYEYVKEELRGLPLFIQEYNFQGVPALVITTREGQKNPKVWLAAHMDVVDGSENVWMPVEKDGRLIGRGTWDMKFAIASYIELFKELADTLPQYDIGIMITGDEECGGFNGTQALVEKEGYRGGCVLLPDGGGGNWKFEEAAKGLWRFDVTATGKSAHGSRPWEGASATHALVKFLQDFMAVGDSFWVENPEHWHLTYTVAMLTGGMTANQVAGSAQAVIDVRFTHHEQVTDLKAHINRLVAHHPLISTQTIWESDAHYTSRENEAAKTFARIAKERYGIECGWRRAHGASDARHFSQHGIPVLLIEPKGYEAHSEEEWVELEDLERFYEVMKDWAKEVGHADAVSLSTSNSQEAHRA
jgi:succinyl-diaminopimelate desuccinylase